MRYILTFIFSVSAFFAQSQQVNPVTDYTFANKMSSGRSTVTDTAAYFSVGPRFGAIRGMMPPIVVDTAVVVANKRNGLLIFSVQKNKMQVWDSAGSKWADLTGAAGSAITSADTAAMLLPYLRKVDTTAMLLPYLRKVDTTAMLSPYLKESDTTFLSNRINLKVNISDTASMLSPYLLGSGTANYLPKFNASRSIVDSKVYESATNLMFNTTTPYFTTSGIGSFDINGSTASVLVLRKGDTARAYWSHNGSTMDINNIAAGDIRFYTNAQLRGRFQTDGTFRLNSLTGTGTRSVVADANGVLSASSTPTDLIDTTYISTRAWRQKGDDSLGAIIATKGSGTVTSVATGYGLSGGTITTTGTIIADSNFVASRLRVGKVVDSLALVKQNVLTNPVTGTGTTNYVSKFTGTSTIGNSTIFDDGEVKINTTTDAGDYKLQVSGNAYVTGTTVLAASSGSLNVGNVTPAGTYKAIFDGNIAMSTGSAITRRLVVDDEGDFTGALGLQAGRGSAGFGAGVVLFGHSHASYPGFVSIGTSLSSNGSITFGEGGLGLSSTYNEWGRFDSDGELLLSTTTDVGNYKLQVSGSIYNTTGAVFSASSGNVGIGITSLSSSYKFGTFGPINIQNTLSSTNGSIAIDHPGVNTWKIGVTTDNTSSLVFGNDAGGTFATKVMYITNAGNVGIGMSPTNKLDVSGRIGVNTSGQIITISSYYGSGSDGKNIYIGGGGNSSSGSGVLGSYNTAVGIAAMNAVTTGHGSEAFGVSAISKVTTGIWNAAFGSNSLSEITTGDRNIGVGYDAGRFTNSGGNNQLQKRSIFIGVDSRASASSDSNQIVIGYEGRGNGSNTVTIGNSSITDNYFFGSIRTSAPTDGTAAPWKLGSYVTTAPTATGYVQVEINGVKYKLLAATY